MSFFVSLLFILGSSSWSDSLKYDSLDGFDWDYDELDSLGEFYDSLFDGDSDVAG